MTKVKKGHHSKGKQGKLWFLHFLNLLIKQRIIMHPVQNTPYNSNLIKYQIWLTMKAGREKRRQNIELKKKNFYIKFINGHKSERNQGRVVVLA